VFSFPCFCCLLQSHLRHPDGPSKALKPAPQAHPDHLALNGMANFSPQTGWDRGWEGLSTFGSEACVPLLLKELFVFLVLSLANQLAKVLCICGGQVPAFFCIPDLGVPLASH